MCMPAGLPSVRDTPSVVGVLPKPGRPGVWFASYDGLLAVLTGV